jgi:hypothetical protein
MTALTYPKMKYSIQRSCWEDKQIPSSQSALPSKSQYEKKTKQLVWLEKNQKKKLLKKHAWLRPLLTTHIWECLGGDWTAVGKSEWYCRRSASHAVVTYLPSSPVPMLIKLTNCQGESEIWTPLNPNIEQVHLSAVCCHIHTLPLASWLM